MLDASDGVLELRLAVAPGHHRRHRAHHSLDAASRLDAVLGTAVIQEVELDIASAPHELKGALLVAVGGILASLKYRQVCGRILADT